MIERRTGFFVAFLIGIAANISQIAVLRTVLGQFYGTELHLGTFLAVWLFGIAAGSRLAGTFHVTARAVIAAMVPAPVLSIGCFIAGTAVFLPPVSGELLPFLPVCAVIIVTILPVSMPVGALLPALLADIRRNAGTSIDILFALESAGGAVGGILFAAVAGGAAEPVTLMFGCVIVSSVALALITNGRMRVATWILVVLLPFAWPALPRIQGAMDEFLWRRFHVGYTLVKSFDTPYQSVKIARYGDQFSLFLDQNFVMTWPDRPMAEQRIHSFLSCLPVTFPSAASKLLLVGIPAPDLLEECLKYKDIHIIIVDLDSALVNCMKGVSPADPRIEWVIDDPRSFLRKNPSTFDAVMVLPSDPTTLVGNRIFTREAIREAVSALSDNGVAEYAVTGAENYLGGDLEKAVLSLYRDMNSAAAEIFAVPGDPIRFRVSRTKGILATSPAELSRRFVDRGVRTSSFQPGLFADLLLPFRVSELRQWLTRSGTVPVNTDIRPAALSRQLHLWDIYSGSGIGSVLRMIEQIDLGRTVLFMSIVAGIAAFLTGTGMVRFSPMLAASCAVALTGFFGLAAEMMLLLTFQVRHGAMFGMASLFFGLYMLGLALGSCASRSFTPSWPLIGRVKLVQLFLALAGALLLHHSEFHTIAVLGGMTLLIALIAGLEFPILTILAGGTAETVAGLIVADTLPAMIAAATAGIWMLPALGMEGAWLFLAAGAGLTALFLKRTKCG